MAVTKDAIAGYDILAAEALALRGLEPGWTDAEWVSEFERTRTGLRSFLLARDPYVVLAKTAMRTLLESGRPRTAGVPPIEQAEAEFLQALFLTLDAPARSAPTSPGNFVRLWSMLSRHVWSFLKKQPERDESDLSAFVKQRVRLHTVYYRNLFDRSGYETAILGLLRRLDSVCDADLGYRLSDVFRDLIALADIHGARP